MISFSVEGGSMGRGGSRGEPTCSTARWRVRSSGYYRLVIEQLKASQLQLSQPWQRVARNLDERAPQTNGARALQVAPHGERDHEAGRHRSSLLKRSLNLATRPCRECRVPSRTPLQLGLPRWFRSASSLRPRAGEASTPISRSTCGWTFAARGKTQGQGCEVAPRVVHGCPLRVLRCPAQAMLRAKLSTRGGLRSKRG